MTAYYLINSTQGQGQSGPATFKAGALISDPAAQATLLAEGGLLWPATDTVIAAAAGIASKMYAKGYDEAYVSRMMMSAVLSSAAQGTGGDGIAQGFKTAADGTAAATSNEVQMGMVSPLALGPGFSLVAGSAYFIPQTAIVASDTNYATIQIQKRTAGGAAVTVGQLTTSLTVGYPTGNIAALAPAAFTMVAGVTLLPLDVITYNIAKAGSGIIIPISTILVYGS